jgi:hypothetical protein
VVVVARVVGAWVSGTVTRVVVVARVVGAWVSGTVTRVVVVARVVGAWVSGTVARVVVVALVVAGAVVVGWVAAGCVAAGCGAGAGLGVGTATTPLTDVVAETLVGAGVGAFVVAVVVAAVVAICADGCSVVAVVRLIVDGAEVPVEAAVLVVAGFAATHTNVFFTFVQRSNAPFTVAVLLTAPAAQRKPARAGTAFAAFGFVAALADSDTRATSPPAVSAAIVVAVARRSVAEASRRVMTEVFCETHQPFLRGLGEASGFFECSQLSGDERATASSRGPLLVRLQ